MIEKYLTTFQDVTAHNNFINSNECPLVNVSYIASTDEVKYYKEASAQQLIPFTLHIDELPDSQQVEFCFMTSVVEQDSIPNVFKYKLNNNDWVSIDMPITTDKMKQTGIMLSEGDTIQIMYKTNSFNEMFWWRDLYGTYGLRYTVSGNIMSLVWAEDFAYASANKLPISVPTYRDGGVEKNIKFSSMFSGGGTNGVVDASNLWLPTNNLPEDIFSYMFSGLGAYLTAGPDVKAKYLPHNACYAMFDQCIVLEDMPNVYAETIEGGAIEYMFAGCTSLVNTTQLHIKNIDTTKGESLKNVFTGCTSLTSVPVWDENVNIIGEWVGTDMFKGCSSLVSAENFNLRFYNGNVTYGFAYWFTNCASLEKGPKFGLVTPSSNEVILNRSLFGTDGSIVNTMYYLNALGEIKCSDSDVYENYVAASGTIYVSAGSEYLSGGSLYGQLPLGLGSGWTVAEYQQA